jgi:triosephosphate isomerase
VCIGERVRDEDAQYLQFLRKQLTAVYDGLTPKERLAVIIAYEPIWAIGPTATGAITPEDLEELMRYIRKILTSFMPGRANEKVQILYGGSVDDSNVQSLTRGTGVDGLLIGRASTDPKTFTSLVKKIS